MSRGQARGKLITISNILSTPELKDSPDSDLFIVALGKNVEVHDWYGRRVNE